MTLLPRPRANRVAYDESVFINCPFTADYADVLRAYVFAAMYCGLRPRCAREADDGGENRLDKIFRILRGCRWSIHDLSYVGLDPASGVARFNMPFELGLSLAVQRLASNARDQQCVIFEAEAHKTKQCLSDISGQDCRVHDRSPQTIVREVRDWLRTARGQPLPGAEAVGEKFNLFEADYPATCVALHLDPQAIVFVDLCEIIRGWLAENG